MIYGWQFVALYFMSSTVVTPIFAAIVVSKPDIDKLSLHNGEDAFAWFVFMLFWPISIPAVSIAHYVKSRKDRIIEKGNNIFSRYNIENINVHDRTAMILIPEGDLKFLLKWRREGYLTFNKQILELVRDELMHRNAERDLLK